MTEPSIEIPGMVFRAASARNTTLNVEDRTIDVVFSTGAPVRRQGWDGHFLEVLRMTKEAVDLDRMNSGSCPLLDSHESGSMANRLGVVAPNSARIENGQGVCKVMLSTSKSGEQVLNDLRAGLPLSFSIGYRISEFERDDGDDEEIPTLTAVRWEVLEVSAVPIPADVGAHARAADPEVQQRVNVPVTSARSGSENKTMTTTQADPAATLERERADRFAEIAERYDAPTRLLRKALGDNSSEADFRAAIIDHRRQQQERSPTFGIAPQFHDNSEMPTAERIADAVLCRLDRSRKPEDDSRAFHGLPLIEMARRMLDIEGRVSTRGLSGNEIFSRAFHSTSDFPAGLNLVVGRLIKDEFAQAESELKKVARKSNAADFKNKYSLAVSMAGQLQKVNEHGEFKRVTLQETQEVFSLTTFGAIFGLTRQAIVSDQIGMFDDVPGMLASAAAATEGELLADMIVGNRKMSDGQNVFSASHGNLAATGTALSIASLNAGRLAMRKQRDAGGNLTPVTPKFLVVPPELEGTAEALLATVNASKIEDVNAWSGRLELLIEPRLKDGRAWYLLAARSGLEYGYLEGAEGPQSDQRVGFDIDGTEWKVTLDFGAGWSDFRGAYKNPGVAP